MYEIYTVLDEDSIDDISTKFNTTIDDIYMLNGIDNIKKGMQIVVPKRKDDDYWYYTVKKGDTIYDIAKRYDVDEKIIILLNGLDDEYYIYPNETLLIPKKGINVYFTKEDDTIRDIMGQFDISVDEFLKDNEDVYLRADQIITFRRK